MQWKCRNKTGGWPVVRPDKFVARTRYSGDLSQPLKEQKKQMSTIEVMIYLAQHKIYTLYLVANPGIKIGLTFFMKKLYFPNSLCEPYSRFLGEIIIHEKGSPNFSIEHTYIITGEKKVTARVNSKKRPFPAASYCLSWSPRCVIELIKLLWSAKR